MTESSLDILRCPRCAKNGGGELGNYGENMLVCQESDCGYKFPIVDGKPVMLTEAGDFLGYRQEVMAKIG